MSNWNPTRERVHEVIFRDNGQLLVSSSDGKIVKLWDVYQQKCLQIFTEHTSEISSLRFSLDGDILVSASQEQEIKIWNLESG